MRPRRSLQSPWPRTIDSGRAKRSIPNCNKKTGNAAKTVKVPRIFSEAQLRYFGPPPLSVVFWHSSLETSVESSLTRSQSCLSLDTLVLVITVLREFQKPAKMVLVQSLLLPLKDVSILITPCCVKMFPIFYTLLIRLPGFFVLLGLFVQFMQVAASCCFLTLFSALVSSWPRYPTCLGSISASVVPIPFRHVHFSQ